MAFTWACRPSSVVGLASFCRLGLGRAVHALYAVGAVTRTAWSSAIALELESHAARARVDCSPARWLGHRMATGSVVVKIRKAAGIGAVKSAGGAEGIRRSWPGGACLRWERGTLVFVSMYHELRLAKHMQAPARQPVRRARPDAERMNAESSPESRRLARGYDGRGDSRACLTRWHLEV